MPDDAFAPQWAGRPVPAGEDGGKVGAAPAGPERRHHRAARLKLGAHPLDADGGVGDGHAQGGGELVPTDLAHHFEPPE